MGEKVEFNIIAQSNICKNWSEQEFFNNQLAGNSVKIEKVHSAVRGANTGASLAAITRPHPGEWCLVRPRVPQ